MLKTILSEYLLKHINWRGGYSRVSVADTKLGATVLDESLEVIMLSTTT